MSHKDLWFDEYERLINEGYSDDEAAEKAMGNVTERLYDKADYERKRRREQGEA